MDLDTLLLHYFDAEDPAAIDPERLERGLERLAIDFGLEQEPGRRFALWALLDVFGNAPPPAEAFEDADLRRSAEDYLSIAWKLQKD